MTAVIRSVAVLLLAGCLGACASTRFTETWKSPSLVTAALDGEKIAAFLISDDESARRMAEDALARELTARGARGVAGYTIMSTETAKDEPAAEKALRDAAFDAIITLRIVGEEARATETPGTWHTVPVYRYWGGYWRQGWRSAYTPGQVRHDTIVSVETLVYSLESGELVWGGMSETVNPDGATDLVHEIAAAADDAIKKSGLLR